MTNLKLIRQIFLAIKELILFVPSALLEGGTEFHDIPGLKDFNPIHFPILSERLEMAKLIFTIIGVFKLFSIFFLIIGF